MVIVVLPICVRSVRGDHHELHKVFRIGGSASSPHYNKYSMGEIICQENCVPKRVVPRWVTVVKPWRAWLTGWV